jgi:two-component sensor histidine kinase
VVAAIAEGPARLMAGEHAPGPADYAKALLNILEDAADERLRLKQSQAAVLNILEDFDTDRQQLESTQRAILNILEDSEMEKVELKETQRAVLNIMDDFETEHVHLQNVQRAIFNIFDDLHDEKGRLECAQKELVRSWQQVQTSLREKEVLLQEVHHRVKNNLQVVSSLINMQVRKLRDVSARSALEECQSRVLSIALIHQKLYQSKDYGSVSFSDYARSLAANIFHATGISPGHVALCLEIETLALSVDKAIPCGLILNELITNALKHGFPNDRRGEIRIQLRKTGGDLELLVADDGVGIDPGFDPARSDSLGMQLVQTLVEQLDGELDIFREAGTTFRVRFPIEINQ